MPEDAQDSYKISIPPIDISSSEPKQKGQIISYLDRLHRDMNFSEENINQEDKPFFIIPLRLGNEFNKNELIQEKERKPYVPRTEIAKRTDAGFYQAFYAPESVAIFADYDDVIAQFTANNPDAQFTFDAETGKVAIEDGLAFPREINDFIQHARQYDVPIVAFDPEGSVRRINERQWFQALHAIDINSRSTTLYDLQDIGLLQKAVPGITQQEVNSNRLVDTTKQVMRKFYRKRQHFWHPDRWANSEGLTEDQKTEITEMSTRLNRISSFI